MDKSQQVWPGNLEEKILQFLILEFIFIYICDLQYRVKFPPPTVDKTSNYDAKNITLDS